MFVKQKRASLFVHFQGHPEYNGQTLLKEYRRDVRRFLKGERTTYPSMPHGYFNPEATKLMADFRERASGDMRDEIMESFPNCAAIDTIQNTWQPSAVRVYQNWLHYLAAQKSDRSTVASLARVG
jgi:homoserine O-succinyltransferase